MKKNNKWFWLIEILIAIALFLTITISIWVKVFSKKEQIESFWIEQKQAVQDLVTDLWLLKTQIWTYPYEWMVLNSRNVSLYWDACSKSNINDLVKDCLSYFIPDKYKEWTDSYSFFVDNPQLPIEYSVIESKLVSWVFKDIAIRVKVPFWTTWDNIFDESWNVISITNKDTQPYMYWISWWVASDFTTFN